MGGKGAIRVVVEVLSVPDRLLAAQQRLARLSSGLLITASTSAFDVLRRRCKPWTAITIATMVNMRVAEFTVVRIGTPPGKVRCRLTSGAITSLIKGRLRVVAGPPLCGETQRPGLTNLTWGGTGKKTPGEPGHTRVPVKRHRGWEPVDTQGTTILTHQRTHTHDRTTTETAADSTAYR